MCATADHWVCSSAFKNSTANFKVSWSLSKDYFCKSDNGTSYLLNQCTILQISENNDLFKMSIKRKSAALNSSGHACSMTPELKWALREALGNYSVLGYHVQLVNLMLPQVSCTTLWQSSSSGCNKDLVRRYSYAQKRRKKSSKGRVNSNPLKPAFCKGCRAVFAWKQWCVEGVLLLVWNPVAFDSQGTSFIKWRQLFGILV